MDLQGMASYKGLCDTIGAIVTVIITISAVIQWNVYTSWLPWMLSVIGFGDMNYVSLTARI